MWLERMNGLTHFRTYYSCEGHWKRIEGCPSTPYAHIFLQIEDQSFIAQFTPIWNNHKCDFENLTKQFFPEEHTNAALKLEKQFLTPLYGLDLRLKSRVIRETDEMPATVTKWFEETTGALARFELAFIELYEKLG